jgi:hypothetical protein
MKAIALSLAAAAVLAFAGVARAATVTGDTLNGPYTIVQDLSSVNGTMTNTNAWATLPNTTTLECKVTAVQDPSLGAHGEWRYTYEYDFNTVGNNPSLTGLYIDVSDSFTKSNLLTPIQVSVNGGNWTNVSLENGGGLGIPGGNGWDWVRNLTSANGLALPPVSSLPVSIKFDSDRVPAWGDFFAADGGSPSARNAAYDTGVISRPGAGVLGDIQDGSYTLYSDKAIVPDSVVNPLTLVPEPTLSASMWSMGVMGLFGLCWYRLKRAA